MSPNQKGRFTLLPETDSSWRMQILGAHLDSHSKRCTILPDRRQGKNIKRFMIGVGMSAVGVFFNHRASVLEFQKSLQDQTARNNACTLFGVGKVPSNNHILYHTDGVPPSHFDVVLNRASC